MDNLGLTDAGAAGYLLNNNIISEIISIVCMERYAYFFTIYRQEAQGLYDSEEIKSQIKYVVEDTFLKSDVSGAV